MEEPTKDEIKELLEEVLETKTAEKKTEKKLIFDGRQYSLRFPKQYVDEAQIDVKKDVFEIELKMPDPSSEEKPHLSANLKRK
jgi:hypothetical protein